MSPTLGLLQTELLAAILELVDDVSPHTTRKSVVLVSKRFYATAQLVAHRRKTLSYNAESVEHTQQQIQQWLNQPSVLQNIRQVKVISRTKRVPFNRQQGAVPDFEAIIDPLVNLVTKISCLVSFDFEHGTEGFPLKLLRALETHHPRVKLHIWDFYRDAELELSNDAEKAIAVSPILQSIRSRQLVGPYPSGVDLRLAALIRIVSQAPNLRFASILQSDLGRTYIKDQEASRWKAACRAVANFLPDHPQPNRSVRTLTLEGFHFGGRILEDLGNYVSLSSLETLKLFSGNRSEPDIFVAPKLLPNLKRLFLRPGCGISSHLGRAAEDFLSLCPSLESISIWDWENAISLDTILKHGQTLRELYLHQTPRSGLRLRRRAVLSDQVRKMSDECPRLKELGLDLHPPHGSWHEDRDHHRPFWDELASFQSGLDRVQIYLVVNIETHLADVPDYGHDYGERYGRAAWKIIFGNRTRATGRHRLDVHLQGRVLCRCPRRSVRPGHSQKLDVVVRPHERDDRPGEPFVKLIHPDS